MNTSYFFLQNGLFYLIHRRTLLGATSLGHSEPRSNGNEGEFLIPQISKDGTSLSDDFTSYQDTRGGDLLPLGRDAVDVSDTRSISYRFKSHSCPPSKYKNNPYGKYPHFT